MVLALAGIWWLRRGGEAPPPDSARVQAGVLGDGFTTLVGPRDVHDSRRIVELDRDGKTQEYKALRVDGDVRVVGTREGTAVGWREGRNIKLATLDVDGRPDHVSTWGKKATQLCEGTASNEYRFAVGWLESDGRVWIVHGPLGRLADASTMATGPEVVKGEWCGIASAERNVVLLWRDNGRLYMNFCGPKDCGGRVVGLPIERTETLLGFGCIANSCLFATRDKRGATRLLRVTEQGRALAVPLELARADTAFSIVGAGGRAFAISYIAKDGRPTIQRITVDGEITSVWHFEGADEAPTLAWADEKLLVVLTRWQSESFHVLDAPRE